MTTFFERFPETGSPEHLGVDYDAEWFAGVWLHESDQHIARTVPVIAVVRELAATLLDDLITETPAGAHADLRQALRMLRVFAREDDTAIRIARADLTA
jgi:hypothetical protein